MRKSMPFLIALALISTLALGIAGGAALAQGSHAAHGTPVPPVAATTRAPTEKLAMDVLPSFKLGPDGKLHDAFSPYALTVRQGDEVVLTISNWDNMKHSFTAPGLGVNVVLPPAAQNGKPSVTVVRFKATAAGTFVFRCMIPCDMANGGWSMSHVGYMIGQVNVQS